MTFYMKLTKYTNQPISIINCCLGWRPRRTIIFANFDARNYGYIGGQQWLEVRFKYILYEKYSALYFQQNLDDISAKTSLYINMPACSDGSSNMEASFSTVDALFDAVETVNKTNMNFSVTLDQLGIDFRNRYITSFEVNLLRIMVLFLGITLNSTRDILKYLHLAIMQEYPL